MAGLNNTAEQAKHFWGTRSNKQRMFLLGGAGATVALLMLFVRLLGTPEYKPLFTNLDPGDAQAVATELSTAGIPHQLSTDGKTISVPADKVDTARMQAAAQGEPHTGQMGFELFDKMSWGQTEFDEKVDYQRALEGELERSIETLSDVESARVNLVMPTDSIFLDQQQGAKASVVLKLRDGELSKDAVRAIARLVAGAVPQLKPQDVSIVNADTDEALGLDSGNSTDGAGNDASLAEKLIQTLEPVVGVGRIRATVNVQYNHATTDESQEKYDPTVSVLLSDQKSEDHMGGSAIPSGVPGTASNIPKATKAKAAAPATSSGQSSTTENAQYGVDKTVIHTITPAGEVQRISAAILVDDAIVKTVQKGKTVFVRRPHSPQEMTEIRDLAEAAIGFNAQRGDTISVEDIAFSTDPTDLQLPTPSFTTKVQKTVQDYSPLLRPVFLLALFVLAYLFILRPVQKHVLSPGRMPAALPEPSHSAGIERPLVNTPELTSESLRAAHLKEQTTELIRQKPQHTARALQAWLREEPS
jgi:flagellar M-ring protein FliF